MTDIESLAVRVYTLEKRLAERDARIVSLERSVLAAEADAGVMPKVVIRAGNSELTVYLHGAHVTSWKVAGVEQLFCSKHAIFKPPKVRSSGFAT